MASQESNGRRRRRALTASLASPARGSVRDKCSRRSASMDETVPMKLVTSARKALDEGKQFAKVWELACKDRESSLTVQKAVEIVARALADVAAHQDTDSHWWAQRHAQALVSGMHGHVVDAIQHPHANYVVMHMVEILPTEHIAFVATELAGSGVWVATHCYGCRTMLRLVRHCGAGGWAGECVDSLMNEVLEKAGDLCRDEYAKYVIEEFLENGLPEHRQKIVSALRSRLLRCARHRYSSGLIEKVVRTCDPDDSRMIVTELLGSRDVVQTLLRNQFGIYVLRDLALSGQYNLEVRQSLLPLAAELQSTKQGRKLWEILVSLDVPY